MVKRKRKRMPGGSLKLLREIQSQLGDIDSKIDHLIKSYRKFYFITDYSDSYKTGFKD